VRLNSILGQSAAVMNSLMNRPVNAPLQIDTSVDLLQKVVNILAIDATYLKNSRTDIRHITDEIHSMDLKNQVVSSMSNPIFGITWDNMRMPISPPANNNSMYMFSVMAMISIPIAPWFPKGYKSKIRSMDFQIQ